ncbi:MULTISPECIES: HGxxPAAW family protein [unclassified Streptomyces]|uniref:HGxxPAAW family protein n=1 Tax=unclassified Streptomyces TaxID=2593676 RepID=UPI00070D471E|nr:MULTISPECIES: HGxxPAAW family protein [unclassified Streptomyces]KRD15509.1 hypothetical protein ASE41_25610 [Streptomyces sp. Root264]
MAGSSHGHTPAAWTGVTIAIIGFTVAGAFMVMAEPLGFWAGMAIVALSGFVGLAMRAAGLGRPKTAAQPVHQTTATATATREPAGAEG